MPANFRGLRLDVAVALSDTSKQRTLYEIAKALGRRSGDIQRVVRQMTTEGILGSSDTPPTRGTYYWLKPEQLDALEHALMTTQPEGQLIEHQRAIRVRAKSGPTLMRILRQVEYSAMVSWAAECDGGWLLALMPSAQVEESLRLETALENAGFKCDAYRLGTVMSADTLRRKAIASVGDLPTSH